MSKTTIIGRFAPSPSGPLHLGSLMSATCSFLQAKSKQGKWLVRIEDVDTPRVVKGMADIQLKQLESYGFEWDDDVLYQSSRFEDYADTLAQLKSVNLVYACECTRRQLKESAKTSEVGIIYPKNCINKNLSFDDHSLRFKTNNDLINFEDKIYGNQQFNLQDLCSDWVIKRIDDIYSYHLAVVVDDAYQGVTEIVRGFDILPLTPIHIDLQKQLNLETPNYFHHPLIEQNGQKLSKQNHAESISNIDKINTLNTVLKALGQSEVKTDSIEHFWVMAIKQWDYKLISKNHYSI